METYTQPTVTTTAQSDLAQLIQESNAVAEYLQPGTNLGVDLLLNPVHITPVKGDRGQVTLNFNKQGTETVEYGSWGCTTTTKIRITHVDVVYWMDHPIDTLIEDAIEEGRLDEDFYLLDEEAPEDIVNEADKHLIQFIEDGFEELTGERAEVVNTPESFSCYGGWVATVRLRQTVSVARTDEGVKARLVA